MKRFTKVEIKPLLKWSQHSQLEQWHEWRNTTQENTHTEKECSERHKFMVSSVVSVSISRRRFFLHCLLICLFCALCIWIPNILDDTMHSSLLHMPFDVLLKTKRNSPHFLNPPRHQTVSTVIEMLWPALFHGYIPCCRLSISHCLIWLLKFWLTDRLAVFRFCLWWWWLLLLLFQRRYI